MPLYEFKCMKCQNFFELLVMNKEEQFEASCPECNSEEFERVLSTTNHSVGGKREELTARNRSCSNGSCTTYNIPGHSR